MKKISIEFKSVLGSTEENLLLVHNVHKLGVTENGNTIDYS